MRFRRKFILVKIITIVLLLLLLIVIFMPNKIGRSIAKSSKHQMKYPKCEVIHVGVVCTGYDCSIVDFYTILKSLYYFRNNPLHFHIIFDEVSVKLVKTMFKTWTLPQVSVSFYDVNTLESDFWMPQHNYYPEIPFQLLKFSFLKAISTDIANKIIIIDPNMFLISDIRNLWNEFENFNKNQAIGFLKPENNVESYKENKEDYKRYNTDVILYNLKHLKTNKLTDKLFEIINDVVFNETNATDQDVIHKILNKYQNLIYFIPNWKNLKLNNTNLKILGPSLNPTRYENIFRTVLNHDGSLLRNRLYTCMKNTESPVTVKYIMDNCSDFNEIIHHEWRTLLFIREFEYNVTEDDLTFVSQLSYSRRHVLEELGKFWKGPVSLTVYLTDSELHDFITFIENSRFLKNRYDIAYHAVFKDGDSHPINVLRNIALRHVITPYVFLVDIDFIPMPNLYEVLKDYVNDIKYMEYKALVVPAFETKKYVPETKNELLEMLDNNTLLPFHQKLYRRAHAPTNFQKWRLTNNTYQVSWRPNFEPYIVVQKNVTEYDERFFGYGWNKVSHIMELKAQDYEFLVLPNVYIVHKPHKFSNDRHKFIKSRKQQKCLQKLKSKFMKEINRKYVKKRYKEEY